MKKLLFLVAVMSLVVGCRDVLLQEDTGGRFSVSFQTPGSGAARAGTTATWKVAAWLEEEGGAQTQRQETTAPANAPITISFDAVAIGTRLKVGVQLEDSENPLIKYEGSSELITVGAGSQAVAVQVERVKYTVTFDKGVNSEGTDELPPDITVDSGTKLEVEQLKDLADTDSYIFEGWYDKSDDAQKLVGEGYPVTKSVTLVARWRDRGIVASVTFEPKDGTGFYSGDSLAVTLASEEGASVHYKLDEGEWQEYTAGSRIPITVTTTITAYATKEGLKASAETTATYTVYELTNISVTPPARIVYSEGDTFEEAGMVVTAHYNNGTTRTVEGLITTDTTGLTRSAGIKKPVEVSYTENGIEKTAAFNVDVASYQFTETVQDVVDYVGTMTDGTYKQFGDWPQTIRGSDVEIGEGTLVRGGLTYHVGSDGNYYVAAAENAYEAGAEYQYSNGLQAGQGGSTTVYFKVEPIVWRVLTEDYNSTGKALLLAERILTGGIPYYVDTNQRTIGGQTTVYPNNWQYSTIRAWLNGRYEADDTQDMTYEGKGFLQTAFTADAQDIADTSVDNSAASTFGTGENPQDNPYASDTSTTDKIFLLSQQEATNSEYGFDVCRAKDNTRIRVTTDYAKATGANQNSTGGYGGWWWLRSPEYNLENFARGIYFDGEAYYNDGVSDPNGGVVPALCVQLPTNN